MMLRLAIVVASVVGLGVYPSEAVWEDSPLDRAALSEVQVDVFLQFMITNGIHSRFHDFYGLASAISVECDSTLSRWWNEEVDMIMDSTHLSKFFVIL
jgi:hypothetical protein